MWWNFSTQVILESREPQGIILPLVILPEKIILPNNDYRDNRSFARATMNIDLGEELSSPEFHQRSVVFTTADWENKNYWYPIPQSEIDRNKELIQNPGY
ncbi:RagB/SusD family nutrient uptake outer membrane protein [uncultured Algoriphagus sp.]|uniref:RagB/SusD family nutrient uptake outer membrane protein n=1 Tax=uncultured Algoriphagus sp. TaxID=417365 RepID=UPI0030EC7D87|tara:strand:+ start:976 stop:1275 length:300 start_codon:yes stop_codon:yes gene_type:complete